MEYRLQHKITKFPYELKNGQILCLDTREQMEHFRNCLQSPASWDILEDEDIGTIYNQVTICEVDVKRQLQKHGYAPTKENADLVGHSYAVRKAWSENSGSAWCDHIDYGIDEDEVKDQLKKEEQITREK